MYPERRQVYRRRLCGIAPRRCPPVFRHRPISWNKPLAPVFCPAGPPCRLWCRPSFLRYSDIAVGLLHLSLGRLSQKLQSPELSVRLLSPAVSLLRFSLPSSNLPDNSIEDYKTPFLRIIFAYRAFSPLATTAYAFLAFS